MKHDAMLTIRLPLDQYGWLSNRAHDTDQSMSQVLRKLIAAEIKRVERRRAA